MAFTDTLSDSDLQLIANDTRKDYNKLRHSFYRKAQSYYNQAIAGSYHKEEDLIEMLNELSKLKQRYLSICDILKKRGVRVGYKDSWTGTNTHIFEPSQLLHSA